MLRLPSSEDSLLVRTNFADDDAWGRARSAALAENGDGFRAYVRVVDERAWEGAQWEQVRGAAIASREHAAVLFIVDRLALASEHPILVLDLSGESRPPFRCIARELWSVDNNLNIANMDWDEFANTTDDYGVFRGFE
jgi:hypothetical protein